MSEYKTITAHVDYIREVLRQTSDDTNYPDELIYKTLLDSRALLIHRELDKMKFISPFNYNTFCVPLECTSYHDCECVPSDDCKVLKSTVELPRPMRSKIQEMMQVNTTDGKITIQMKDPFIGKYQKYSNTQKKKPFYWIINNKLVIFGLDCCTKTMMVSMIAEDPLEVSGITNCGPDEDKPCFDATTDNFPIDGYLVPAMYELTLKALVVSLKMREDDSNDASQDNKEKS